MKNLSTIFVMAIVSLGLLFFAAATANADCPWTVKGTIKVKAQNDDLKTKYGEIIPLKGVQVKVSAASAGVLGTEVFDEWATVNTNSLGEFSVSKSKNCTKRAFKIEIKFVNDDLELRVDFPDSSVRGAVVGLVSVPKWYLAIKQTERNQSPGTIQFPPIIFDAGKNNDLNLREARDHADLWVMANALRDHFANMGPQFAFNEKSVIEYPNNDPVISDNAEQSFCNPVNHTVNIFRSRDGTDDHLGLGAVFHEMAHSWAFKHTGGELDMALNLFTSGTTHCFNDQEHVSFHEAFAEVAENLSRTAIFGRTRIMPFNRDALKEGLACDGRVETINSMRDMERHEFGWMSLFRMLTTKDLYKYTYRGEANSSDPTDSSVFITERQAEGLLYGCTNPTDLHLKDLLDVFLPHRDKGYTANLTNREMNINSYMNRAATILGFEDDKEGLKNLLDPTKTTEPKDEICGKAMKMPVIPGRPVNKKP